MNVLTAALSDLNRVGAKVVFVTTDPSRDTPERLDQWLSAFPVDVVGLTGTIDQLEAAQEAAGVTAAIAEAPDANGKYVVGHSSAMNVYTPDDLQHLRYAPTHQPGRVDGRHPPHRRRPHVERGQGRRRHRRLRRAEHAPAPRPSTSRSSTAATDDTLVGVTSPDGTGGDAARHRGHDDGRTPTRSSCPRAAACRCTPAVAT